MYVDGSAAEGDMDNPKVSDGSDKLDVISGATLVVTDNVTIDGNDGIEATLKNITIDDVAYNAKIGGAIYLNSHGLKPKEGRSVLNATNCTFTGNSTANGGGVYIFDGESLFKGDGLITSANKAIIKNTTITDNVAPNGADVTYGRFYSDTFEGDKEKNDLDMSEGNTIGDYKDVTFTSFERTELVK